jgi:two-component system, LuxR family, response regulator FixJ
MQTRSTAQHSIVHVVDDDPAVLESLSWLLRSRDVPFKTYSSALDFLADFVPDTPGCLVLDVHMPGIGGLELQEQLKAASISIPIVFISGHSDVPIAVRAMKHGAIEFLQKPFDQAALSDAIARAFVVDRQWRDSAVAEAEFKTRFDSLSLREREILGQLLEGYSAKEIGRNLSISPRTVEYHRNNILGKMNVRSLLSLVAFVGGRLAQPDGTD